MGKDNSPHFNKDSEVKTMAPTFRMLIALHHVYTLQVWGKVRICDQIFTSALMVLPSKFQIQYFLAIILYMLHAY